MKTRPKTRFELFSYRINSVTMQKSTAEVVEYFAGYNGVFYCPPIHYLAKKTGKTVQGVKRAITVGINDGSITVNAPKGNAAFWLVKLCGTNRYRVGVARADFWHALEVEENKMPDMEYVMIAVEPEYEKFGYHDGQTFENSIIERFKNVNQKRHSKQKTHNKSQYFTLSSTTTVSISIDSLKELFVSYLGTYAEKNVTDTEVKMVPEFKRMKKSDAKKYADAYVHVF